MRKFFIISVLFFALMVSVGTVDADWRQYQKDSAHTGYGGFTNSGYTEYQSLWTDYAADGVIGDVNGDGEPEIFASYGGASDIGGRLLDADGNVLWEDNSIVSAGALANLDGDDNLEIVTLSGGWFFDGGYRRENTYLVVLDSDGSKLWENTAENFGRPTVADINNDGSVEILVNHYGSYNCYISIFENDGTPLWTENVAGGDNMYGLPSVGNLDSDSELEIATSEGNNLNVLDSDGTWLWNAYVENGLMSSPVISDIDADSDNEVIISGQNGVLHVYDNGGTLQWAHDFDITGIDEDSPSVADLDDDGYKEIVVSWDGNENVYCLNHDNTVKWIYKRNDSSASGMAISSLGGDGKEDILISDIGLDIVDGEDGSGSEIYGTICGAGTVSSILTSVAISDLRGSGTYEIWSSGKVFGLRLSPNLLSPSDGTPVGDTPTFTWENGAGSAHNIVISKNADLSSPVVDTYSDDEQYTVSDSLAPDTYYWAVASELDGDSYYSETRHFGIRTYTEENLWPKAFKDSFNSAYQSDKTDVEGNLRKLYPYFESSEYDLTAAAPIIGDVNSDGIPEIYLGTEDGLVAFSREGELLWENSVGVSGEGAGVTIADMNEDGEREIIVGGGHTVRGYDNDGNLVWSFDLYDSGWSSSWNPSICTPIVVGDFDDDDNTLEGLFGFSVNDYEDCTLSNPGPHRYYRLMVIPEGGSGNELWDEDIDKCEYGDPGCASSTTTPAVGDINSDGVIEIVQALNDFTELNVLDKSGNILWQKDVGEACFTDPTLGNLDADDNLEIAIGIFGTENGLYVYDGGGTLEWSDTGSSVNASCAIGDIDSDGENELAVSNLDGQLIVYESDGAKKWTYNLEGISSWGGPVIADVDSDENYEILIGDKQAPENRCYVYVLSNTGTLKDNVMFQGGPEESADAPFAVSDIDYDGIQNVLLTRTGSTNILYNFEMSPDYRYNITLRYEENFEVWPDPDGTADSVENHNVYVIFHYPNYEDNMWQMTENQEYFYMNYKPKFIRVKFEMGTDNEYSRVYLVPDLEAFRTGDESIDAIGVKDDDLSTLSMYTFELSQEMTELQRERWGPPNGQVGIFKYDENTRYYVSRQLWSATDDASTWLKFGRDYELYLKGEETEALDYGTIFADTNYIKTVNPVDFGTVENVSFIDSVTETITVGAWQDNFGNIVVDYEDVTGGTNWVMITITNEKTHNVAYTDNHDTNPDDFQLTWNGPQENIIYSVHFEIGHDNYGGLGNLTYLDMVFFGSEEYEKVTDIDAGGVFEDYLFPDAPVTFAAFGSFIFFIAVMLVTGPTAAGIGVMMAGLSGIFLKLFGVISFPWAILGLAIVLGFFVYITGRRGRI